MDPSLLASLQAYFASNPGFAAEYQRHMAQAKPGTDTRSQEEWLYDFMRDNPSEIANFNTFSQTNGTGQAVPAEQALLESVLNDYVNPDIQADAQRRADATGILARVNGGIDQAIDINGQALNGQRLQDEYGQAADTAGRLRTSATDEGATMRAALATTDAQRRAALDPLIAERLAAAETAGAGVRQGLESTRDQLARQQAGQGYYGGSSMDDAALVRATIEAQQNAAGILGGAKVQNATDLRGIGDDTAKGGYDIAGREATGVRNATDYGTQLRQGYFDNDYTRRLDAALRVPALESSRLDAGIKASDYGYTGINRGLNLLNWFSTSGQAPAVQPYYQDASQSGNDVAGLGAGLLSAGVGYASANNWGATTPKKTAAPTAADWNPYGWTG